MTIIEMSGEWNKAKNSAREFIVEALEKLEEYHKNVDDLLVEKEDYVIATQDKNLKQRLKQKGIKLIVLRSKKYLIFD